MLNFFTVNKNKELLIALYFLLFILGWTLGVTPSYYNEFRAIQVVLLLFLGLVSWVDRLFIITKVEIIFFTYLTIGFSVWDKPSFIITELLLAFLLYKSFKVINYNNSITKIILLSSFLLFMLLPLSLWEFINIGIYDANWYPLPWNIRVYDSYFLITSIFAMWFYINEQKYKCIYLLFSFLAFFAVLLDGGRSVTLAYTAFVLLVTVFNKSARLPLIFTYAMSWLAYIALTYIANLGSTSLRIGRESSSGRIDLWINGLRCWVQQPIFGCGFYQLEQYPYLSAHPHNIFIQILTETGIIGLGFLLVIVFKIINNISWKFKKNYFVIAALMAVSIDMSLSGIYVYPITQMALLWLFVFLLKNPVFEHVQYFKERSIITTGPQQLLSVSIYALIAGWFLYLIMQAFIFPENIPITPPRFWGYGYQLY